MSDFLNSPIQQEATYLKIKDPTVRCRESGETLDRASFVMVARDQIVLLLTHEPESEGAPSPKGPEGLSARDVPHHPYR